MSAGKFIFSFYGLDNGDVANIRLQPETLGTGNPAAAGPATLPVSAKVSNSNRSIGIKPRAITLAWTGAAPDGYDPNSNIRVPIMQKTVYDGINIGSTFTYAGASARVVGKSPERVR